MYVQLFDIWTREDLLRFWVQQIASILADINERVPFGFVRGKTTP